MSRETKMNVLTSPEQLEKVNKENMQLLHDFLEYLRSVGRSETTIYGYENDIKIAFVWNLEQNGNKFFIDWTKRNIVAFQNWLINENEHSASRVRRIKASLSSMSNYICNVLDDEFPTFRNIMNAIENPVNRPVREKTVWEDEELEKLLDELMRQKQYQKACYLALGMYSGRRKSELCRFKVSDFADDKLVCDGALYKSDPIKTKGRGGGKYIPCYTLAKKFKPYLDAWLKAREALGVESDWLFYNKENPEEHIKISTINSWANTFSRMSSKPAYIHSLRHYFTTSLAKAGIPDGVIQSLVAWESGDMVRLYTDLDVDEQIASFFRNGDIHVPESKDISQI